MEKRDLTFSENLEAIREKEPIDIEPDTRWERSITPAEQIRFEQNGRFAEVVYDKMIDIIDGKISLEQMEIDLSNTEKSLSSSQQKAVKKIYENILNRAEGKIGRYAKPLSELYKNKPSAAYDIFLNYAKTQWEISLSEEVSTDDVSVMPWGAIVVKVHDKNTWDAIEKATDSAEIEGFKLTTNLMKPIERDESVPYTEENDKRYIEAQSNRTVVVCAADKSEQETSEIIRHELFHELYDKAIAPAQKSRYRNREMDNCFGMVKNEVVAYALTNRWQTDEKMYFPSSYQNHDIEITQRVHQWVLKSLQEEGFAEEQAEEKTDAFIKEMCNMWREIARLRISKSSAFEEATKAALTAQSFKEIGYKLSLIDADKTIDAVEAANKNGAFNFYEAVSVINKSLKFRVPIARLDELVSRVQGELATNDKITVEDREWVQGLINYFETNPERWLKPGEQRK